MNKSTFKNKSKICAHYRGIFSIHADRELKIDNCKLIETQCICKGDKFCEWSYNVFNNKKKKK